MNAKKIIQDFLANNPKKRFPDKTWKICNPEKYLACIKLYEMGYSISDIAKHVGCTYDTLRKTFVRDKVFRPKQYKQKSKIGIGKEKLKELDEKL